MATVPPWVAWWVTPTLKEVGQVVKRVSQTGVSELNSGEIVKRVSQKRPLHRWVALEEDGLGWYPSNLSPAQFCELAA